MMMPSAYEARLDFFASEWTLLRLSAALWRTPCFKGRYCSRKKMMIRMSKMMMRRVSKKITAMITMYGWT